MVIQNMKSVLTEEGQWKFPHEFNPENFLNEKGEFVKPEAFMPFSAGLTLLKAFLGIILCSFVTLKNNIN